jgi:catechol 2,3-dioxygenase-like lactoylglutathione lyase family enzyme
MFKIKHIDHLVLRVVNLQAMLDFYITVLGCSLEKIQEDIGLYQVRAGNSLIDFVPVDGPLGKLGGAAPGEQSRNLDHFCVRVDRFDANEIVEYLRSKGIEPGSVESRYGAEGEGPSIYVKDPENNLVELKGPPWEP